MKIGMPGKSHIANWNKTKGIFLAALLFALLASRLASTETTSETIMSNIHNIDKNGLSFSVLTANVGNLDIRCRKVLNMICYKDVEQKIAENIQHLRPDIIALQEVLAKWQCQTFQEKNPKKVCFNSDDISQALRLIGEDYSIMCNSRNQFECIGVHIDFGEIIGCPRGGICNSARTGVEINDCDNGFTVSAVTVKSISGFTFDVINAHPQSTDAVCRSKMIKLIFEGHGANPALISEENVLIMGDFNLDPWRDNDQSVLTWKYYFDQGWAGKFFQYHNGIVEHVPPYLTTRFLFRDRTVDFIVSNFAEGICSTLGETPGTFRLDGGAGTDHRAIYGNLYISGDN